MKNIAIYPSPYRDPERKFASVVERQLANLGVRTTIVTDDTDVPAEAEMLITLGGDGTILLCGTRTDVAGLPILGINIGHLGFMTGIRFDELDMLDEIVQGEYKVSERLMLDVEYCGERHLALNEVSVRAKASEAVKTAVYVDDKYLKTYFGDGLIVATPTGSTAWSLSAGSIPIDPETDAILVTPVCSVDIGLKAFVANSNKVIMLEAADVVLNIDGKRNLTAEIGEMEQIRIRKAERVAKLVHPKDAPNFFNRVREKLCEHIDTLYDPIS